MGMSRAWSFNGRLGLLAVSSSASMISSPPRSAPPASSLSVRSTFDVCPAITASPLFTGISWQNTTCATSS
ncbi:MAG: hypothetical protein J3R72DRAFT_457281 [Linnemannia gamsii]|nr:MAG: hypothetical protein J3R72DRAFT_457281 [Linnemannia gamsii]